MLIEIKHGIMYKDIEAYKVHDTGEGYKLSLYLKGEDHIYIKRVTEKQLKELRKELKDKEIDVGVWK